MRDHSPCEIAGEAQAARDFSLCDLTSKRMLAPL